MRNNTHHKLHIIPKSPGLIITLLLFLVVEIIFLSLLIALDILPTILNADGTDGDRQFLFVHNIRGF